MTDLDLLSIALGFAAGTVVVLVLLAFRKQGPLSDKTSNRISAAPVAEEPDEPSSNGFYDGLVMAMPDMLVVIGPDRVRRYISPSCEQLLGYTPEQMTGQSPINAIHPDDRASTMKASERLFQGEVSTALTTYRHRHADGHYVWLEAHFAARRNESGELQDYIGVVRNIGERRRARLLDTEQNARIRENNRLLQMAEHVANIGHWRVDVQENALIWSDQVYRIHGVGSDFTPSVADGLEFYCEDDRERVSEMVSKAFEHGEDFKFQARIIRPDGELRHVASVGHAETSPTGEVITVFGVFKDITETVLAQEQLRQSRDEAERASRAKAHFLANMSHEIRTPMNGVIGFADLLIESDLSEEHHEYARMISESGKAMLRLLNELLDLSKIEAGRMQLSREPVDFGHLVRSSVRLFEPNAKAKGIALEMEIAPDLPEGISDKLRVRQIILNLVGNAIKFTEEGSVRIRAREEKGQIVIRVIDTGPGISSDKLHHIFEEFTQLESSGSRETTGSGTGLGLAIAQQLAELMGGKLFASSEIGKGSIFTLTLPLVRCSEHISAPMLQGNATTSRETLAGRHVLLAEDAEINRKLAIAMLSRLGMTASIAEDGKQAVEQVLAARASGEMFDAVLMDMQMPEMDGLEATRRIRTEGVTAQELPIIAITANAYADDIEQCLDAGMQDHLAKPIAIDVLGSCLERWLGKDTPVAPAERGRPGDEIDEARELYEQRKEALRDQLAEIDADGISGTQQSERLRGQLHVMAGIAAHFDDAELGDLARKAERELKLNSNSSTVTDAIAKLQAWFAR